MPESGGSKGERTRRGRAVTRLSLLPPDALTFRFFTLLLRTIVDMLAAAKDESVPLLAASLLSGNSCPGFGGCNSELRRVIELANVLNASGLATSLYDDRRRSRDIGKERDSESGLDYFGARYYGSALGRFTSPDEFKGGIVDPFTGQDIETNTALPYADITDPQTLNKYSYVRNYPLRYTDPNGHCIEDLCIGEGALVYAGYTALAGATAAYLASPSGQQALHATGQLIQQGVDGLKDLITTRDPAKQSKLQPGPYAGGSIPARSPDRNFTPGERDQINDIGNTTGCHTCGTTTPGTKSGNFVPDHQPPTGVNTDGKEQQLYPQCLGCSPATGRRSERAATAAAPTTSYTQKARRDRPMSNINLDRDNDRVITRGLALSGMDEICLEIDDSIKMSDAENFLRYVAAYVEQSGHRILPGETFPTDIGWLNSKPGADL